MNITDQVALEVALDIKTLNTIKTNFEARRLALQPRLRQVWEAFEQGFQVNNGKTKGEWAKKIADSSVRNIQYILKGGNKNRGDAKHVSHTHPEIEAGIVGIGWDKKRCYAWIQVCIEQKCVMVEGIKLGTDGTDPEGRIYTHPLFGSLNFHEYFRTPNPKQKVPKGATMQLCAARVKAQLQRMNLWSETVGKELDEQVAEWGRKETKPVQALPKPPQSQFKGATWLIKKEVARTEGRKRFWRWFCHTIGADGQRTLDLKTEDKAEMEAWRNSKNNGTPKPAAKKEEAERFDGYDLLHPKRGLWLVIDPLKTANNTVEFTNQEAAMRFIYPTFR